MSSSHTVACAARNSLRKCYDPLKIYSISGTSDGVSSDILMQDDNAEGAWPWTPGRTRMTRSQEATMTVQGRIHALTIAPTASG